MKNILLICFMMILGINLKGQSYLPFPDNNVSFFQDTENRICALKVVEKLQTNDTINYRLNSVWNFDDYQNITPDGISWNGNECVRIGDAYYFFNLKHDSLKILPFARLNTSWICYQFSDNDLIVAKISKKEISSVLGSTDSVKTIVFQRQSKTGEFINDLVNGKSIEISKNHGFTKIIDFKSFPGEFVQKSLIGMTHPSLGKAYLTNREIYDFDIADEFHYEISYSNPPNGTGRFSKVIRKVIGKHFSNDNDTVTYTFQTKDDKKFVTWMPYTETNSITVDTIKVKYVLKSDSLYVPDEPIIDENYGYVSYMLSNDADDRRILMPSAEMLRKEGDHWRAIMYDPGMSVSYKEGCGLFDMNSDYFPGMSHETMVYYKKGNQTWGNPYLINSVDELKNDQVSVYPNPLNSNGILNIRLAGKAISTIEVFNLHGISVFKTEGIDNSRYTLNLSNLPKGLYLLEITDSNKHLFTRKITK